MKKEIVDLLNYSYYNWKPKLVIVLILIHNFHTSLIIYGDISVINNWKECSLLW